jgi:hypothetical protein
VSTKLHSELGASKSERWMNCPGSVNAERGLFVPAGEYAILGTAAHELAERCLRKDVDPFAFVGMVIKVEVECEDGVIKVQEIEVDEDMAEAVTVYVDYCKELVRASVAKHNDSVERFIEKQFTLSPLNPPEPMFGTADFVVWDGIDKTLEVVDYKHGMGVIVEAEKNKQFMQYALGAVVALNKKPKRIKVTVVQPRAPHPDGVIRSYEFGWDELIAYKREAFAAAQLAQDPNAPRAVGDWCRFCKAQASCPAQHAHAVAVAQSEFEVLDNSTLPAAMAMDDEQIARVLTAAPIIEEWIKSIRLYVSDKLEHGIVVPGWKLVPKRATRKWIDETKAERVLSLVRGINKEDLHVKKFVSPAQAEAVLKKAKAKIDLDYLIEKKSSGTNLVADTDPRPALLPTAQVEFSVGPVAEEPKEKAPAKRAKRRTKTQ